MDREILKEILKTKSVELSLRDIEQLMDEELEKSPEEMDTELVDLCLECLHSEPQKQVTNNIPKKKKVTIKKILLIAAAITVFAAFLVPASADKYSIDVSPFTLVEKIGNRLKITAREPKDFILSDELSNVGIDPKNLPDFLFDENCIITDFTTRVINGDGHIKIIFEMTDSEMSGYVNIRVAEKFNEEAYITFNITETFTYIKEMYVNEIRIFVFSNDMDSMIKYCTGDKVFSIQLSECDYEKALQIANLIG